MEKPSNIWPAWSVMLVGFMMVAGIGYVDYLTGDYSLLIFYAVPIAIEAWCLGRWGALVISVFAGLARFVSDYYSYSASSFRWWNSLQDMIFLLLVGLLIATVKNSLNKEETNSEK